MLAIYHKLEMARSPWPTFIRSSRDNYAHAKIPDRNFAIALQGARRKLMEVDVGTRCYNDIDSHRTPT